MQGQVSVAPARWWHVPGLSRLMRETRRHPSGTEAVLWAPGWSPTLGLLRSVWTVPLPGLPGPRSFVAESGAGPVGLAQMRPRGEPHQWEVVYLAVGLTGGQGRPPAAGQDGLVVPSPLLFTPDRRATRLLGELCDAGLQLGAERIFASVADGGGRYEVFKQVGFAPVVREYDYFRAREGLTGAAPVVEGLRPQQRADAFGLLQLYQRSTPKVVQIAEGKRSRSWDLPVRGLGKRLGQRRAERAWVVERDSRKVAWVRLRRAGRGADAILVAQLMVDPQQPDLPEALVRLTLAAAEQQQGAGVLVQLQEHQAGLVTALEGHGFAPVESRLLMVKQLAAPVRLPQLLPALEKAV